MGPAGLSFLYYTKLTLQLCVVVDFVVFCCRFLPVCFRSLVRCFLLLFVVLLPVPAVSCFGVARPGLGFPSRAGPGEHALTLLP